MERHPSTDPSERTFQYDDDLPALPVPPLDQTLTKYLDAGMLQILSISITLFIQQWSYSNAHLFICLFFRLLNDLPSFLLFYLSCLAERCQRSTTPFISFVTPSHILQPLPPPPPPPSPFLLLLLPPSSTLRMFRSLNTIQPLCVYLAL